MKRGNFLLIPSGGLLFFWTPQFTHTNQGISLSTLSFLFWDGRCIMVGFKEEWQAIVWSLTPDRSSRRRRIQTILADANYAVWNTRKESPPRHKGYVSNISTPQSRVRHHHHICRLCHEASKSIDSLKIPLHKKKLSASFVELSSHLGVPPFNHLLQHHFFETKSRCLMELMMSVQLFDCPPPLLSFFSTRYRDTYQWNLTPCTLGPSLAWHNGPTCVRPFFLSIGQTCFFRFLIWCRKV